MSEKPCSHEGCGRECFEDKTKCIFHCEKNDWLEIANADQWNEERELLLFAIRRRFKME